MILFHGSPVIVKEPSLEKGKPYNDYGRGFYCTEHVELAKEWACASGGPQCGMAHQRGGLHEIRRMGERP